LTSFFHLKGLLKVVCLQLLFSLADCNQFGENKPLVEGMLICLGSIEVFQLLGVNTCSFLRLDEFTFVLALLDKVSLGIFRALARHRIVLERQVREMGEQKEVFPQTLK